LKAYVSPSGVSIEPFGDPVARAQVLGRDLGELVREELGRAGLTVVETPPDGEDYLAVSDRTWITAPLLRTFLETSTAPSRLRVDDALWLKTTGDLQDLPEPGVYEVALIPAGQPPGYDGLQEVTVGMSIQEQATKSRHPAMAHAMPETIPWTDACVHQIDHWAHVLRVNWFASSAAICRDGRAFKRSNPLKKLWTALRVIARVRSLSKWKIGRALCRVGKGCSIHPTAIVELSEIGDGVEIGPYAIVRCSVLRDGAQVESHASVNGSVLGEGARLGARGTANLCVLYPGAFIGCGNGYQACLFGRDAWVAMSVTVFDMPLGDPVKVRRGDERVSSGLHFLGAAVGHRARVGGQVTLGWGAEVPNDATVVGPTEHVLRGWGEGEGPRRVKDGVARPIERPRKRDAGPEPNGEG